MEHLKTALVTGGANGIGRQIALQLAMHNVRVWVADVDNLAGTKLASEHKNIEFITCDFQNEFEVLQIFEQITKQNRKFDILINNVGVSIFKPLLQLTTDEWDQIININLRAAFICAREFAKQHHNGQYGRIINIASTRYLMSEPNAEAYAASKGGIVSLTHALAASLSNSGITVNCISPGWIHTGKPHELTETDHTQHLSGRVGQPQDIASLCLFLCNESSNFINGENIIADGGMTKTMIYK